MTIGVAAGNVARMQVARLSLMIGVILGICACPQPLKYEEPPKGQFFYPTGFAQAQDGNQLFVVSSNSDHTYSDGTLIPINLDKLDIKLKTQTVIATPDIIDKDGGNNFLSKSIPNLGVSPLVSGNQMFLFSQFDRSLITVPLPLNQPTAKPLAWKVPYFLELLSNGSTTGIIGYKATASREIIDATPHNAKFGELQIVSDLNSTPTPGKTFLIRDWIKPGDKPESDKNVYPPDPAPTRRISHIGAMRIINNALIIAVDSPDPYGDFVTTKNAAHLLQIPIVGSDLSPTATAQVNLTATMAGESVVDMDFAKDGKTIFLIMSMNNKGTLLQVDLDTNNQFQYRYAVGTCDQPTALRLKANTIIVACQSGNQILAYDTETLSPVGVAKLFETRQKPDAKAEHLFSRSPTAIWFDTRASHPNRFYVSYSESGTVGIFDLNPTTSDRIQIKGQIGQTAPLNHPGGIP